MIGRWLRRWIRRLVPARVTAALLRLWCRGLTGELRGPLGDALLDTLLVGMAAAIELSRDYARTVGALNGRYVFRTADGRVAASAIFRDGELSVEPRAVADWDARVTFADSKALWTFLRAHDDIVDAIVGDRIAVDGNLNLVYRFGYIALDLGRRLGVG